MSLGISTLSAMPATCGPTRAPVCPDCLGEQLVFALSGAARCPHCGRSWPGAQVDFCPWPATEAVLTRGGHRLVCRSHAEVWHSPSQPPSG